MRFGSNEYEPEDETDEPDEPDDLDEAAARSEGESDAEEEEEEEGTEANSIVDNIDRPILDAARLFLLLRNMIADALSVAKRKASSTSTNAGADCDILLRNKGMMVVEVGAGVVRSYKSKATLNQRISRQN